LLKRSRQCAWCPAHRGRGGKWSAASIASRRSGEFSKEGAQKSGIQFKKGGVDIEAQTHINRLGNYVIDPDRMPVSLEQHLSLFL
jgi:hypothetical protein